MVVVLNTSTHVKIVDGERVSPGDTVDVDDVENLPFGVEVVDEEEDEPNTEEEESKPSGGE